MLSQKLTCVFIAMVTAGAASANPNDPPCNPEILANGVLFSMEGNPQILERSVAAGCGLAAKKFGNEAKVNCIFVEPQRLPMTLKILKENNIKLKSFYGQNSSDVAANSLRLIESTSEQVIFLNEKKIKTPVVSVTDAELLIRGQTVHQGVASFSYSKFPKR